MISFISWQSFKIFSYCWIIIAVIVFFLLQFVTAPYGRHVSAKWGPLIDNRLGWIIMEMPVLAVLLFFLMPHWHALSAVVIIMVSLFCLHYLNRIFVFPFRLHSKGKKMPLLIACAAVIFNFINGFSIGYYFTRFAEYSSSWFADTRFIAGTILFFTGLYINWKADNKLIRLRKPNEIHYVIPEGWLFNYISCPNLFGEMIEWSGFALLCWNLPAFCFLIWTNANLIPRAMSHHKWYKKNFQDYPSSRKAIIPFVV